MNVCERCTENNNCAWQNHEDTICHDAPAFPMTNADRIRSMTDEELAEMLNHAQGDGFLVGIGQRKMSAYGNWLEWLKENDEI